MATPTTIRDYGTHLRTIYKASIDERFATASVKDVATILNACEQAAREGKTEQNVSIDIQMPQDKYNAHICTLLHELNLAALLEKDDYGNPNPRRIHVNWL